ncbi:MAG: hypothetical protein KBA40_01265, partial [Candidatus Peribacteraceae bacterium]|nr:hypothetical protein [Candidatus Peribacteraceae bacterium]
VCTTSGFVSVYATCANGCQDGACKAAPVCGNAVVETGEECDDGNGVTNDGCTSCKKDFCEDTDMSPEFPDGRGNHAVKGTVKGTGGGGGIFTSSDTCLDATKLLEYGCYGTKTNATNYVCPHGCLDGACIVPSLCGNGSVEYGEQCDDGNDQSGDGCTNTCQAETSFAY